MHNTYKELKQAYVELHRTKRKIGKLKRQLIRERADGI